MAIYKTAMGKSVDMSSLVGKNEQVRAVGNLKVNARGDQIDPMGNVTKPVTTRVNERYNRTVGNRSANSSPPAMIVPDKIELTELEKELESSITDEIEIETLKAKGKL